MSTATETTSTATDQSIAVGITLPYSAGMLGGLYAVALHASKDDGSPVICAVQVTGQHFIATNRHTVGVWEHTTNAEATELYGEAGRPDASPVLVPRSAAEWLVKQTPKVLDRGDDWLFKPGGMGGALEGVAATVTFAPDSITIREGVARDVLAVLRFEPVTGNHPPVMRLFPATVERHDSISFNLKGEYLEFFTKGAKRTCNKGADVLRMTSMPTTVPSKPGPVLVEFANDSRTGEPRFRGLIQPNMLFR